MLIENHVESYPINWESNGNISARRHAPYEYEQKSYTLTLTQTQKIIPNVGAKFLGLRLGIFDSPFNLTQRAVSVTFPVDWVTLFAPAEGEQNEKEHNGILKTKIQNVFLLEIQQ